MVGDIWDPDKGVRYYAELNAIVDPVLFDKRAREMNRELYNECWAIPLVERAFPLALSPRIGDWQPTPGTMIDLAFDTLRPK